jgi:hypothetical protein
MELTEVERQVFAKIASDTAEYSKARARIRKRHYGEIAHQSLLEDWHDTR